MKLLQLYMIQIFFKIITVCINNHNHNNNSLNLQQHSNTGVLLVLSRKKVLCDTWVSVYPTSHQPSPTILINPILLFSALDCCSHMDNSPVSTGSTRSCSLFIRTACSLRQHAGPLTEAQFVLRHTRLLPA